MSDREIIIESLKKAERRLRANRLFGDLTFSLSLFLLVPLAFKIWDLFSPFRGRTVAFVLAVWTASLILYFLQQILRRSTLEHAAAQVDRKAALNDELKTAYWFITHPLTSDWVDGQIRRASRRASGLNIDRLYPRVTPATSYLATALLALLIGLNFLPLPWNHNWIYLQAAPAFSLTDAEQTYLTQADQLLKKNDQLNKTDLAERNDEIMKDLQEGKIDPTEAIERLQEIQKELHDEITDTEKIPAQQLKDQAAGELQRLMESLQQRNADSQQAAAEPQSAEGELSTDEAGTEQAESEAAPSDSGQNGTPQRGGQNPSGRQSNDAPIEDFPTQNLNVQLQQEQLTGQYDQEVKAEDIEQASKQERSKLDYRNVPSQLSPAQKDVLNQERVPWEYRRLIKNYFAAIQRLHQDK